MSLRSYAAGCAAVLLACAGFVVLPASPASAATYACKLSFATTNPLPAWNPNVTMSASPASAKPGQTVTVSVKVGTYTNGPVTLAKNKLKPQASVAMSGAQSGTMTVRGPAVGQVVGALKSFPVPTMTGTFKASKAGTVNLALKSVQFVYPGPPPVTTTCTAGGGGDPMGSVKVVSASGTSNTGNTTNTGQHDQLRRDQHDRQYDQHRQQEHRQGLR